MDVKLSSLSDKGLNLFGLEIISDSNKGLGFARSRILSIRSLSEVSHEIVVFRI